MTKPFTEWTVLPHGKLKQLADTILSVTGLLHMPPMGEVTRRMTVVRLEDGRLIVYSAIALDEAEMAVLEGFGRPAYLVVPNELHRLDAAAWKRRYPSLIVVAPKGSRASVEKIVPVDATSVDFVDPKVRFLAVPGTGDQEAALVVDSSDGTTLVLNDLIFNLANRHGLSGWLFKAIGMTGEEPHIPPVVKLRQVKNAESLGRQFEQWSLMPDLKRIVISHGPIIEDEARAVLGRIARELGGKVPTHTEHPRP